MIIWMWGRGAGEEGKGATKILPVQLLGEEPGAEAQVREGEKMVN